MPCAVLIGGCADHSIHQVLIAHGWLMVMVLMAMVPGAIRRS